MRGKGVFSLKVQNVVESEMNFCKQGMRKRVCSLQQSPISAKESMSSFEKSQNSSLGQIEYPQCLQGNKDRTKARHFSVLETGYDNSSLPYQIIQLLTKLTSLAKQLCLTHNCANQVENQLLQVVDQILDGQTMAQPRHSQMVSSQIDGSSIVQFGKDDREQSYLYRNNRNGSVGRWREQLDGSGREMGVLRLEEKKLVILFFKKYQRILDNCLLRMNKYSGQKKLKFLVQTVMKSIFSETMRVSYDLKVRQYEKDRERSKEVKMNRDFGFKLMMNRMRTIMLERTGMLWSFKQLKRDFYGGLEGDNRTIKTLMKGLMKIDQICNKKRRSALQLTVYRWRINCHYSNAEDDLLLVVSIKDVLNHIVASLTTFSFQTHNTKQIFTLFWREIVQIRINELIERIVCNQKCFYLNLFDLIFCSRTQNIRSSIINVLQQSRQSLTSHRADMFRSNSFLSSFSLDELKECLITGEICRCEKNGNNLLLIPVKAVYGIIFCVISTQCLRMSGLGEDKEAMSVKSFRDILKMVEMLSPHLGQISSLCSKIEYNLDEMESQGYCRQIFTEYLKTEMGRTVGVFECQKKGEFEVELNSNRLNHPNQLVLSFIHRFAITTLMIYHCSKSSIKPMPCICYGDQHFAKSHRQIMPSIFQELVNSKKDLLVINRNGISLNIVPLRKDDIIGLICYQNEKRNEVDHEMLVECLVPLVVRNEGDTTCQECQLSLNTMVQQVERKESEGKETIELNSKDLIEVLKCQTMEQMQDLVQTLLVAYLADHRIFHRCLYKIDVRSDSLYYYLQNQIPQFVTLDSPQLITHKNLFWQNFQTLTIRHSILNLIVQRPLFDNVDLHVYQNEHSRCFRLGYVPLVVQSTNTKQIVGYIIVGFYSDDQQRKYDSLLVQLAQVMGSNKSVFNVCQLNDAKVEQWLGLKQTKPQLNIATEHPKNMKFAQICELIGPSFLNDALVKDSMPKMSVLRVSQQNLIELYNSEGRKGLIGKEGLIEMSDQIISTHQKLFSGEGRFKETDRRRKVRPLNRCWIESMMVLVGRMKSTEKVKEMVKDKLQIEAWIANDYLPEFKRMASFLFSRVDSPNQVYHFLPLITNQHLKHHYFIIIAQTFSTNHFHNILNLDLLQQLQTAYSKVLQSSLAKSTSNLSAKRLQILRLSEYVSKKGLLKQSMNRFLLNYLNKVRVVTNLAQSCQKVVICVKNKNKSSLRVMNDGFRSIWRYCNEKRNRYVQLCQRIGPLLDASSSKLIMQSVMSIFKASDIHFDQVRACKYMVKTINEMVKANTKLSLTELMQFSRWKGSKHIQNRLQSVRLLRRGMLKMANRTYETLFQLMQKKRNELGNSIELIDDECANTHFRSVFTFLQFVNERLKTILKHSGSNFGAKMQVLVVRVTSEKVIIYKYNAEQEIVEVIESREVYDYGVVEGQVGGYKAVQVGCKWGERHLLLYRIDRNWLAPFEQNLLKKIMANQVGQSYWRSFCDLRHRAQHLAKVLIRLMCPESSSMSQSNAKAIFLLKGTLGIQQQCIKLNFWNRLLSLRQKQSISQLVRCRSTIGEQSRSYLKMQYEFNTVNKQIFEKACDLSEQQKCVLRKVMQNGDMLVGKSQLRQLREFGQDLEGEEQRMSLQYQIRSKTYSANRIVSFCERKMMRGVLKSKDEYLMRNKGGSLCFHVALAV